VIVCPFHGKHIRLGLRDAVRYCVREYPLLGYGGMFFARCSGRHENGLNALLDELTADHVFAPSFAVRMAVPGELVIENAFDDAHFRPTHGVRNDPRLEVHPSPDGPLIAEGTLEVPVSVWQRGAEAGTVAVPYVARAFSPHVVFSHLSGGDPYWVITGTTPVDGGCVVRQALAVPNGATSARPGAARLTYLARQARAGLEQDRVIWEHLRPPERPLYSPEDAPVLAFRKFCRRFRADK
jgi:3-ketosteroid 9alpha-monooxygenase subunit A